MTETEGTDQATSAVFYLSRILFSSLTFGVLLSLCLVPAAAQFSFDKFEVKTGVAKRQTVLTGFLLGGNVADLAVVSIDRNGGRRLQIHAFEGGAWKLKTDTPINPDILFFDIANIGGRDRILMLEQGHLKWFDPESEDRHDLIEVSSRFNVSERNEIPFVDVTRDLNNDGIDDIVIPGIDGFLVFIQKTDGSFDGPQELGPPEPFIDKIPFGLSRTYGEIGWTFESNPLYQKRVHQFDYDRDGRTDLVFWNGDRFDVYTQNKQGRFAELPIAFPGNASFDTDGVYSLYFRTGDEDRLRILHSINDMNGDGVADLVILSAKDAVSRGSQNLRRFTRDTRFKVYLGKPVFSGTEFPSEFDTSIEPGGYVVGMRPHDFEGDGRVDMMFTTFRIGVYGFLRVLVAGKVSFDLKFYRMDGGRYPDEPNAKRKFKSEMDPFDDRKESFFPFVLLGDVDGDGRSDLVMAKDRDEMQVFKGIAGKGVFAKRAQKIKTDIPIEEYYTRMVDLNQDGKQDILMHHASSSGPHRLTVLVAR